MSDFDAGRRSAAVAEGLLNSRFGKDLHRVQDLTRTTVLADEAEFGTAENDPVRPSSADLRNGFPEPLFKNAAIPVCFDCPDNRLYSML